jgi:hypothetical protein
MGASIHYQFIIMTTHLFPALALLLALWLIVLVALGALAITLKLAIVANSALNRPTPISTADTYSPLFEMVEPVW